MIDIIELERRINLWKQGYWEVPDLLDTNDFDFDWRPDPYDRPYIHQFGTQHQKTGGPKFIIPENEGTKYQSHQHAIRLHDINNRSWRPLINDCTIDFSWHPDDTEPPFIYVFGNQWYNVDIMPSFQYRVKGATQKKFIHDVKASLTPNKDKWEIPTDISDDFDYSWVPHPHEPQFNYQFGTQHQKTGGPKFVAFNSDTTKYVADLVATKLPDTDNRCWRPLVSNATIDYSWHPDDNEPPYIYVFGNQWYDSITMPTFQYRVKGATEKKYVDIRATLLPDTNGWDIPTDIEDNFDYSWRPNPNDPPFTYQFGTQHQKTGGPRFAVANAQAVKYIAEPRAVKKANMRNWRIPEEIEEGFDFTWHPDDTEPNMMYQFGTQHQKTGGPIYVTRGATHTKYCDAQIAIRKANMRNWRIIEPINNESFDFSWHPDETEDTFTHIFGNQFHLPEIMPTVMYKNKQSTSNKYNNSIEAELVVDKFTYTDSIFDSLMENKFQSAYAHFVRGDSTVDYNLVRSNKVSVHLLGEEAIVPRSVKTHLYDKLTDYDDVINHNMNDDRKPLDIVFVSNGESCAEDNYTYLVSLNLPNRIVRVMNVDGRVASQYTAANASETPWYFLVNAKLKVNEDFDFNWQPNIYKSRRHYIFTAKNPINDLEYGHMAIVANNKKLTLATQGTGLDFTMESANEVVNTVSGAAIFNSAWDVWRTAFREVLKLKHQSETQHDEESIHRLSQWVNVGHGEFGEASINGALDACRYYDTVNGEFEKLRLSYDWAWLKERYTK